MFITGRRQVELDVAVSLIGKNVMAVQGDVSKLDDLDRLYETVRQVKGHVDVVFANAGVVDPVSLAESTPETYDKHFNLNARAARRQCIDHPVWIGRMANGRPGLRRVFGDESSIDLLCPDLGRGVGQPWHSSERNQSGTDGNAHGPCRR